jgi:hypothetical protein
MANWKLTQAGIGPGTNEVNMGHIIIRAELHLNKIILKHESPPNVKEYPDKNYGYKGHIDNCLSPYMLCAVFGSRQLVCC